MLNVRLYFDTGFDGVNIPVDPSLLDNQDIAYVDVPAVDLLQRKGLGKLTIKSKYGFETNAIPGPSSFALDHTKTLESVDYVKITGTLEGSNNNVLGAVYYSVLSVEMQSVDTAVLILLQDYITTAGGFRKLKFNAGIITRKSGVNESFGEKDKFEDEYLGCAYPLILGYQIVGDTGYENNPYTLVESTIDLTRGIEVKQASDPNDPTITANIATMKPISGSTTYKMAKSVSSQSQNLQEIPNPTGARIYSITPGGSIELGIINARSLGLEKCILNQYQIPTSMLVYNYDANGNTLIGIKKEFGGPYAVPEAKSDRVNVDVYKLCRMGMIGASGERVEFDAEQLYVETWSQGQPTQQHVSVVRIVDPRPDGRPYYRFGYINHNNQNIPHGAVPTEQGGDPLQDNYPFAIYAVAGAKWNKLPLMFTEVSGMDIIAQKFKNTRSVVDRQFAGQNAMLTDAFRAARISEGLSNIGNMAGLAGQAAGGIASIWGGVAKNVGGAMAGRYASPTFGELADDINLGGAYSAGGGIARSALGAMQSQAMHMAATNMADIAQSTNLGVYTMQRNKELYDFGVQMYNVVPEVTSCGDVDFMRDITQNRCVVYRYEPDSRDVSRLTKILKMFGEKDFTSIDGKDDVWNLVGGYYFKYIRIQGADVRTNYEVNSGVIANHSVMSLAEREGVKSQLEAGVRIWNIVPKTYEVGYTDYTNYQAATPNT